MFPQSTSSAVAAAVASGGPGPTQVTGLFTGVAAVIDDRGVLWLASLQTPEVMLVAHLLDPANRSVLRVPLSDATGGTAFNNALPRAMVKLADGRVAVQNLGSRIQVIRRPGT